MNPYSNPYMGMYGNPYQQYTQCTALPPNLLQPQQSDSGMIWVQ